MAGSFGIVGVLALAGCGSPQAAPRAQALVGEGEQVAVALADATSADDVVAASWELGFLALRAGQDDDAGGAVVSPSSLVSALAMVTEGAVGDEGTPFDAALGASGEDRAAAVSALLTTLARYDGDPSAVGDDELPTTPVLHAAQRVVVDDDAVVRQSYLDRLVRGYGAGVAQADLGSSALHEVLDPWVHEHSGGLVPRSALQPDPRMRVALQDAVVLAAAWQQPFLQPMTEDRPFVTAAGERVDVPTMRGELQVATVQRDGWTAVRLPYADDLAADVLLPPSGSDVATSPAAAGAGVVAGLSAALDAAQPRSVLVDLPTVDLTSTTDLMPVLDGLGITGTALSGVVDGDVTVGQAVQQAVLQVDEDGTRAAAVTEIAMLESGPLVDLEVQFDRPFLFVVRDATTGWPVFLASVTDPSA